MRLIQSFLDQRKISSINYFSEESSIVLFNALETSTSYFEWADKNNTSSFLK